MLTILAFGLYYETNVLLCQRQAYRECLSSLESCEADVANTKAQISVLKEKREALKRPDGIEDVARGKLGMIKKGEVAYVVDGVKVADDNVENIKVTVGHVEPGRRPSSPLFKMLGPVLF